MVVWERGKGVWVKRSEGLDGKREEIRGNKEGIKNKEFWEGFEEGVEEIRKRMEEERGTRISEYEKFGRFEEGRRR